LKIKLSIDIGACFDILAIQLIKSQKSPTSQNVVNYFECLEEIKEQLGGQKFFIILNSQEFKNLKAKNEEVFNAVSKAQKDEIPASVVDTLNHGRYLCKGRLQEKFFGEKLTEQKVGY